MESEKIFNPEKEAAEKLNKLKGYLVKGFILHGSKLKLDSLTPQQAHENDLNREVGRQNAVYGAKTLEAPVIMALINPTNIDDSRLDYSEQNGKIKVTGKNLTVGKGYIYVLPKETFQEIGGDEKEIISYSAVTPVDVIEVDSELLKLIPTIELDKNVFEA